LQQRTQVHRTMSELREKVENTRDKMRLSKQAREHLISFSVVASLVGLVSGYAVGGFLLASRGSTNVRERNAGPSTEN
jgi:hypothetical protein